jgi:uncharacterized FAD-dependent dehydrogenase
MIKELEIKLLPAEAADEEMIRKRASEKSRLKGITDVRVLRRSIDARGKRPLIRLRLAVYAKESFQPEPAILSQFQAVDDKEEVIIVGAGPTGYFAALELIELGFKPIIFDRGKDVRTRRRDLRAIQQFGEVNPHSNYCFGEGGGRYLFGW